MNLKEWKKIQIITIVFTILFIVLSACDCIETGHLYMRDYQEMKAGDILYDGYLDNCFAVTASLGILQILLMLWKLKVCQAICILLSVIELFISLRIILLNLIGKMIMGGISSPIYELTMIGYVVLILSVFLFLLHIKLWRLLKTKNKTI